jgi:GT2 family glycosyltransferase/glycosyltransferase involved in cell wall biosynthesis
VRLLFQRKFKADEGSQFFAGMRSVALGLRDAGNRITGGGLRNLARRALEFFQQTILRPVVKTSSRVFDFGSINEGLASRSRVPAGSESTDGDRGTLVNALYRTALGRFPDEAAVEQLSEALRAGTSIETIAQDLVDSHEFQTRHGSGDRVTAPFVEALYCDGLGRSPTSEDVASWLRAAAQGASRSIALAVVASSPEALVSAVSASERRAKRSLTRARNLAAGVRVSFLLRFSEDKDEIMRSLESIRIQTKPQWEVVLVVPAGTKEADWRSLERLSAEDSRIVLSKGSSDTLNLRSGFSLSGGDYVAVLDPGDQLIPSALAEIARGIGNHPDVDILYSDEDILSASGEYELPYLKPEWSPELLYAFNYFGRLTVLRRDIADGAGGFDSDLGPAAEWDLNLRITERSEAVRRVPKVLCHRSRVSFRDRPPPGDPNAAFHRKAIKRFWAGRGIQARVETQPDGTQRSVWDIPEPPLVSIIIPNKNKPDLLRTCIQGIIEKTDYLRKEVIIIDNESDDPATFALYRELEANTWITVRAYKKSFNYSAICNFGASFAKGELLLFLNNDIEVVSSDWLAELVRFAIRPGVGIVGAKLLYPTGKLQHAGVVLGIHLTGLLFRNAPLDEWGVFGSPNIPRNYLAIMGACQLVRRGLFARVGGFDECYQVANSDVALCLNAYRAGYRIAYNPFAELLHHEGASRGYENPIRDMERSAADIRRLGLTDDPYFHPGLSASNPIPTLRSRGDLSTRENLEKDIDHLLGTAPSASDLDLYDDHAIQDATGLPREEFLWRSQRPDAVDDKWSAVRYIIDLLRTRFDLRRLFPRALSDGASGDFAKWIATSGGDDFLLSKRARQQIVTALQVRISARARQTFWYKEDLKEKFPLGFTPVHRHGLFQWFMSHGRDESDLRLEEIWWLFLESAENPSRELMDAYWLTPEWQEACPDGATVFGTDRLANWLATKFRLTASWLNPDGWPDVLSPGQQIRMAYTAYEHWQDEHPQALITVEHAEKLLLWLKSGTAGISRRGRRWLSALDIKSAAAELTRPGVNIIGHFCHPSGLRSSVESIRDALVQAGVEVSVRDIKTDAKDDPSHSAYTGMEVYDITIVHAQPDSHFESVFKRADLFERLPRTYRIAYWYWELDTVPESWLKFLPLVNELWAATNFVSEALKQRFPNRVCTLFPGVQLGKFQCRPRAYFGLRETEEFVFAYVFHLLSVMERKNPLGLIRAFRLAFSPDEPVRLVLKTTFGDRHSRCLNELRSAATGAKITILDTLFTKDETLSLMDACDAYVSLHRSEGLGLTMAEAMLLGKPVIGTRYSGNMDFMDETNSLLVDYNLVPVGEANQPYDANARWAEPSIEHAAFLMRRVYENRSWAIELGARAKLDAQVSMSLEVAGRRMAERLAQIDSERRTRQGSACN